MRPTGPAQPAHLLLDVLDLLNGLRVPYAVVGAIAVASYGLPRSTDDADSVIWLGLTEKNADDLKVHLVESGYQADVRRGDIEDPISQSILVEDKYGNRVDLLSGIRGMDPEAARRCVTAPLLDSNVRIIAPEDLIGMKLFASGPQDLEDVRGILQVSRELLDMDLLRRVVHRYGSDVLRTLDELLKQVQ